MFLIDWVTSLITFFVIFALYLIVVYRKPDVNWGSSTQAQTYKTALSSTIRLANVSDHVKNYHPQVLVLCGKPCARPTLLDLANLITKNNSLLICGDIQKKQISYKGRQYLLRSGYQWLKTRKIKGFCSIVDNMDLEEGSKALIQAAGVGKLIPNVLLMGYKSDWQSCPSVQLLSYFNALHEAFINRVAVAILRMPNGLDYSSVTDDDEISNSQPSYELTTNSIPVISHADSSFGLNLTDAKSNGLTNSLDFLPKESPQLTRKYQIAEKSPKDIIKAQKKKTFVDQLREKTWTKTGKELPPEVLHELTHFSRKQEKGTIDVWWLYDDGGFTMLLPYIISMRNNWSNCCLRVFALANRRHELALEERNMASLLSKFRIDYKSLKMVEDITAAPKAETQKFFEETISSFSKNRNDDDGECQVTTEELEVLKEKTNRQLRLRELLLENSKDAALIVMSLPVPRKNMVSAPLYMAWLDSVTSGLPPTILVRGNQSSVLTFYS